MRSREQSKAIANLAFVGGAGLIVGCIVGGTVMGLSGNGWLSFASAVAAFAWAAIACARMISQWQD